MISTDRGLLPQQKENARHGESGFPIQRYRTTLHATYQDVPPHWHEEAELTLIVRGGKEQVSAWFSQRQPLFFDLVPLTLEEIFIYELGGVGHEEGSIVL